MKTIPYEGKYINPPDYSAINPKDYRYYARRYSHAPEMSDQVGYIMPDGGGVGSKRTIRVQWL